MKTMMNESSEIPLIAILGATASGKHDMVFRLGEQFPVEVVSVDSMKIYRGMDIGTAKPINKQRQRLPHHMIDLIEPDEPYSAAKFGREARTVIREVVSRGRIPLLVGGSGMYLRAILGWIFPGPEGDLTIRKRLEADAVSRGVGALHASLEKIDPEKAETIHKQDLKRIVRALEVFEVTGITLSCHQAKHARGVSNFEKPLLVCLQWERDLLYRRINDRVCSMVDLGWIQEVDGLRQKGFSLDLPALRAIGYVELWRYLEGGIGLEEAIEIIQRKTRQFAKRQNVWFRGMPDIEWIKISEETFADVAENIEKRIETRLGRCYGVPHQL